VVKYERGNRQVLRVCVCEANLLAIQDIFRIKDSILPMISINDSPEGKNKIRAVSCQCRQLFGRA
jgi:hypothetical protein